MFLEPDGRLLADLGEAFSFSLSKAATEGNEVNRIKREGTSSFSIPLTEKNAWIFKNWLFPNTLERNFSRIRVYAYDGAHQLPEDRLDVLRVDLSERVLEVGLFESPELGVIDGAKSLFLNEVDFGSFELSEANLEANWAAPQWEPGADPFYFGLVHYGNFLIDLAEVSPEDFRPLLSVPGTLDRGFCALGWVFDSPLLDSAWFKRLWWYGLGKEYYSHSDWGRLVRVDVETDADINLTPTLGTLYFNTETEDLGANHAVFGGVQSRFTQTQPRAGNLEYRFRGQIENYQVTDQDVNLVFGVDYDPLWKVYPFTIPAGETVEIDISFIEALPEGNYLTFSYGNLAAGMTLKAGFRATVSPVEKNYYYGDVVNIGESVDPSVTFLAFLEGLAHVGFRFDIDRGTRTVTLYPPENGEIFGEGPFAGYYRAADRALDFRSLVSGDSAVYEYPKENIPETLVIGFKKSTDKFIEGLEIPEEFPLYAKRLTFTAGVRGEVEYNENPFFEPTGNYNWFGDAVPLISSPAMWDNTDGARSYEIAPRLLYAAGLVAQVGDDGAERQWSYLGALRSTLPYVYQVPGAKIGSPPALPSGYVVYDDPVFIENSFWRLFLRLDNRFYKDLPSVSVLARLDSRTYHTLSFRDRVWVEILGRPTVFKVIAVRDFQTSEALLTPLTLQIDPGDAC